MIKISGLEEKICEQSAILRKHPGLILETTGRHDTQRTQVSPAHAQEQRERPINKRSSFAGSTNALANANETQPPTSERDRRHTTRENAKQQKQSEQIAKPGKQTGAAKKSTLLPPNKTPTRTYAETTKSPPKPSRVSPVDDDVNNDKMQPLQPLNEVNKNNDEGNWDEVQHKRKQNRKRTVMIGTSNATDCLKPAEHIKYLSVWSFEPSTTEESMTSFLQSKEKSDKYSVKKRLSHCGNYASFIIGMQSSVYDKIADVNIWPQRVRLMEWFLARPRQQQRGAVLPTTTSS